MLSCFHYNPYGYDVKARLFVRLLYLMSLSFPFSGLVFVLYIAFLSLLIFIPNHMPLKLYLVGTGVTVARSLRSHSVLFCYGMDGFFMIGVLLVHTGRWLCMNGHQV